MQSQSIQRTFVTSLVYLIEIKSKFLKHLIVPLIDISKIPAFNQNRLIFLNTITVD